MMRRLLSLILLVPAFAWAQPSTDIWLMPIRAGMTVPLDPAATVNITARDGYDNQPSFTPDGRAILYTSVRADGQSDIYRYDIATRATSRVTSTAESEYSATVMPAGDRFSVIRVEQDSTQRLWSFRLDGSDPQLVVRDIRPVGYHAWIDSTRLALFVLGANGRPSTLQQVVLGRAQVDTVSTDIGRLLVPAPVAGRFNFARRDSAAGANRLFVAGWDGGMLVPPAAVTLLPPGADYAVWLSDGSLVSGAGTRLYHQAPGADRWTIAADLESHGLTSISRLAVSRDGRWLAVVAEPRR